MKEARVKAAREKRKANRTPAKLSERQEAIKKGAVTFRGNDCKSSHGGTRYIKSGQCVECIRVKQKTPEIRQYKKEYLAKNKDRFAAIRAQNYTADVRVAAIERAKKWARANPDKRRAIRATDKAKRRAVEKRGDSSAMISEWIKRTPKKCYWCNLKCAKKYHIDHYVPLAKGGRHEVTNLVIACPKCNLKKNAKDPYEFAASVGRLF